VVKYLVEELGAHVNQANAKGSTALFQAIVEQNLDLVRLLVKELGADVNQADKNGCQPVMVAISCRHEKMVKLLLKEGADPQATVQFGGRSVTAARGAAESGAPAEFREYLMAKAHCSNPGCGGAGLQKCTGCKKVRYCEQACQLAHWPVHKAD
jgi:ankyrin repeat protein